MRLKRMSFRDFESGEIDSKCEEFNLYYLTNAVYNHLAPILEKKNLNVVINADHPKDCIVKADPEIMKIVIGNLLSKSAEYLKKKIEIELSTKKKVEFHILSDDYKVSAKITKKIWKEFYVSDECGTDIFGSNGVGLATVGRILDAHKAKYGCFDYQDGTMFWFRMKKISNDEGEV